jgi:hypothetical protein
MRPRSADRGNDIPPEVLSMFSSASMRPRSADRGNTDSAGTLITTTPGFNEAAIS